MSLIVQTFRERERHIHIHTQTLRTLKFINDSQVPFALEL